MRAVDYHLQEAEQGCAPVGEDVRQIEKGEEGRPGPTYLGRCYDEDPFLLYHLQEAGEAEEEEPCHGVCVTRRGLLRRGLP